MPPAWHVPGARCEITLITYDNIDIIKFWRFTQKYAVKYAVKYAECRITTVVYSWEASSFMNWERSCKVSLETEILTPFESDTKLQKGHRVYVCRSFRDMDTNPYPWLVPSLTAVITSLGFFWWQKCDISISSISDISCLDLVRSSWAKRNFMLSLMRWRFLTSLARIRWAWHNFASS